ncbi:biotin--protein ligase isoform X2 [Teleopsis dalmanni]|uniref:biotin--protein ligase isoform X2 n=1 Tax=Teleopsis dalmanni TaxID=139649 RepID=UPI0018CE6A1E|nr:biotin--protein ligase isoform X2 [Teleopsis dalmanni]
MLTLFYASATFLQSWRIKSVCCKIADQLAQPASVAFYVLSPNNDGFDANLATSDLCTNRKTAKVAEILWLMGNLRGCSIRPIQSLNITPWISFSSNSNCIPFAYKRIPATSLYLANKKNLFHLLIEADVQLHPKRDNNQEDIQIEDYGKLIAWKIDSHLAVLIEIDVENFTKLLISTFLQNNLFINDQLLMLRIETVTYDGKPQPFELLSGHLRKATRATTQQLNAKEWQKHLDDLRALSILANQATEFEYKKNLTEGKTGVIKPDLIPTEQKSIELSNVTETRASAKETKTTTYSSKKELKDIQLLDVKKEETKGSSNKLASTFEKTKDKPTDIQKPKDTVLNTKLNAQKDIETTTLSDTAQQSSPAIKSKKKLEISVSELEKIASATVLSSNDKAKIPVISDNQSMVELKSDNESFVSSLKEKNVSTVTLMSNEPNNDDIKHSNTKIIKNNSKQGKPLNILVYAESPSARENALTTLKDILEIDLYTVYAMTTEQVEKKFWVDNTALLVVCGTVALNIGEIFVDYFLHGGRVLSLCSDILHFILPTYRTAEVREHELVQFSYNKWPKVNMMHHIFCYQPSPVKKNFSTDSDDSTLQSGKKPSIELKDLHGEVHNLDVKVLGTEETWNTPSLLLASSDISGGKAVFSQVHLETNPNQFETDETKFFILKQNESFRLEILGDLLMTYLNINVKQNISAQLGAKNHCIFKNAYFLGHHEAKFQLLEKLKPKFTSENTLNTSKLTMKFFNKGENPENININELPILIHSCPDDFSTVDYFDCLKTKYIGRLVIYAPIINSSMNIINELDLTNGIAILPRQQTEGVGRSNNQWLSPIGCAMFSLQLHISLNSNLGSRLPLIQHIIGVAIVNALKTQNLYKDLEISIKWPNDVYANGVSKIGGLIIKTTIFGSNAVVNVGCGINLNNSKPTICINDLINEFNRENHKNLPHLRYETFIALIFNEIEKIIEDVQSGHFKDFYELYYRLWLHNQQIVTILDKNGTKERAKVVGIDECGYLKVENSNSCIITVQPDGNSFDMLKGLIVPKYN